MASMDERMSQPLPGSSGESLTRRPESPPPPVAWNGGDSGLEQDPPGPAAPGWYPDPEDPARERLWTGAQWTAYSHAAAKKGWFGEAHSRSYWAGPNRAARAARALALIAGGAWVVAVVVPLGFGLARRDPGPVVSVALIGLVGVALVAALAGVVLGIRAIRVSERLGGFGLGVRSIISSGVSIVICAGLLAIVAVALAATP